MIPPNLIPAQWIAQKRDGHELSDDQIEQWVSAYTAGDLPDYQMSAMAMAIFFQGMSLAETVALTRAFVNSGTTLRWDHTTPRADKHSTGGLGDKTSLVLAPWLACCGVQVPMISGRGLGITGGTLDKLESIPGFRTDLTMSEMQMIAGQVGCVITGASDELAPADRKLYALRDVTATVPSRPLIVASILSKKLAEGIDALVLDVKVGDGAFMKTGPEARQLASDLVQVAELLGLPTTALMTDMQQPLGHAVGNAVEVHEAIACLQGNGPDDVMELCLQLGSQVLTTTDVASTEQLAKQKLRQVLQDGSAFEKFEQMVHAQGGQLPLNALAPKHVVESTEAGYLHEIDMQQIGNLIIELGGGRRQMEDAIDHQVGLECLVRVGDAVEPGQPLMRVFARNKFADPAKQASLRDLFVIKPDATPIRPLILDRIARHAS